MIQIISAQKEDHYQKARKLFTQYADSLGFDLEFQGFSQELATVITIHCISPVTADTIKTIKA